MDGFVGLIAESVQESRFAAQFDLGRRTNVVL
jgi:hypothetical protein